MTLLLAGRKRKRGGRPPIALHWQEGNNPLPVRLLRAPRAPLSRFEQPHPWLATGPAAEPFDFCGHVRRLLVDIVARCAALAHVDVSRLLLGMTRSRNGRPHGLQARVTPLRLSPRDPRRIDGEQVQRYYLDHHEFYYLLTFVLPRFLDLDFSEKLITLFHELHHIGPRCDGDLRLADGRCAWHGRSRRQFDQEMARQARAYLAGKPDPNLHDFLRLTFAQLQHRHQAVAAVEVPHPKIIGPS
ncbi:MAG: hypothetical protein FJ271_04125 [Planctomycetes bacterium]|nr:hypothetical protein [Planctomycetota bacterium]